MPGGPVTEERAVRREVNHCYKQLGFKLEDFAHQCHIASLRLVQSEDFQQRIGRCRVARGSCKGVPGQHSWVVIGWDCYDDEAMIVDPTLWSYDKDIQGVWVGSYKDGLHRPHGKGSIFDWGRPKPAEGSPVTLTPTASRSARSADRTGRPGGLHQARALRAGDAVPAEDKFPRRHGGCRAAARAGRQDRRARLMPTLNKNAPYLWPAGPYLCVLEKIGEPRPTEKGGESRLMSWRIQGTTGRVHNIISDSYGSRWFYNEVVDDWSKLDEMVGRTFLVFIGPEPDYNKDVFRNRVKAVWAEYVEFDHDYAAEVSAGE